jgi:hypothetical protein
MSLKGMLARVQKLADADADKFLGATVDSRTGQLRRILDSQGKRDAPAGLTLEDLPAGCLVHHYNPETECAILYQSTEDGLAHVQRVLVIEDVVLGRDRGQP